MQGIRITNLFLFVGTLKINCIVNLTLVTVVFRRFHVIFQFYLSTRYYIQLFTVIFELEMVTYTNKSLDKLYKKNLIPIVLSLQKKLDKVNNSKTELLDKIRKLNDKFDKTQSDVCIMENASNLLSGRLVDTECQCWANAQYSRRECLDIVGIPNEAKTLHCKRVSLQFLRNQVLALMQTGLVHVIGLAKKQNSSCQIHKTERLPESLK